MSTTNCKADRRDLTKHTQRNEFIIARKIHIWQNGHNQH